MTAFARFGVGLFWYVSQRPVFSRDQPLTGTAPGHKQWKCIGHTCPRCSTLISVQMDPIAPKTDTLDAVRVMLAALPAR